MLRKSARAKTSPALSTWPAGSGEMAKRIRAFDWAATPLGPIEAWPQSLRMIVDLMLDSRVIMALPWGPQFILLYNDAYSHLIGPRSAVALGRPVFDTLPELREILEPQLEGARAGETVQLLDQLYPFIRTTVLEDAWFDISHIPARGDSGEVMGVLSIIVETTARVLAERRREKADAALRESEERQAFLLKLADALRPLADPGTIQGAACRILAERFDVDRTYYVEVDEAAGIARVEQDFVRGGAASLAGVHRVMDFGWSVEILRRGECHVIPNTQDSPLVPPADRPACAALQIFACMGAPLIKGGQLVGALCVTASHPRQWRASEVELLRDVGERIWAAVESAQAENALRESERKYRTIFDSIDEGFAVIEMILDENGKPVDILHLEANKAYERHTGLTGIVGKRALEIVPEGGQWLDFYSNVALTGQAARNESYLVGPIDRWIAAYASRIGGDGSLKVAVVFNDITGRKRAEEALRESEERQAFLLKLSDALRPLSDPTDIATTACRLLVEQFGASRAQYAMLEGEPGAETGELLGEYVRVGTPMLRRFPLAPYGEAVLSLLRAGVTLVLADAKQDPRLTDAVREAFLFVDATATVSVPLVKEEHFVAALTIHDLTPRNWTDAEVAIVEDIAERTWAAVERARAEAALRASEQKYRNLFEAMDEGVTTMEMIFDEKGKVVDYWILENNPAMEKLTGLRDIDGKRVREILPNLEEAWFERMTRIVKTGQAERFEEHAEGLDGWFDLLVSRVGGEGSRKLVAVYTNITGRKRREANLAFLNEVSEDLARLTSIEEVMGALGAKIGAHFGISLVSFAEVDEAQETVAVNHEWHRADLPNVRGKYRFAEYMSEDFIRLSRAGGVFVVRDTTTDPRTYAEALAAVNIASIISVPLTRHGRWSFQLSIFDTVKRDWRDDQIELLRELTTRIWTRLERARAEEALRTSEEKYRLLFESIDEGFCVIEVLFDADNRPVDYRFLQANPAFERHTGLVDAMGRTIKEMVPKHDQHWFDIYGRIALSGEPARFVNEAAALGRWYDVYAFRVGEPQERRVAVLFRDISERKRAEQALRESEERFRQFGDASVDVLWIRDADALRMEYASPTFDSIYGENRDSVLHRGPEQWTGLIVPEDRELALANLERVRHGEQVTFEFRIKRPANGEERWLRNIDFPLLDAEGRVQRIGGIGQDITEEKRTASRLEVMVAELQHRTRNLLTVVRSLAGQIMKSSVSLDDFKARFDDRLSALSRVQSLLSRADREPITIGVLIRLELDALGADDMRGRVALAGPEVSLRNSVVQTLTLALHELATNARKYGALGSENGKLAITWSVQRQDAGQPGHLVLEWVETGADKTKLDGTGTSARYGYGRELIERALPYSLGANTSLTFAEAGIRCIIELPLDKPGRQEAH